MEGWAKICAVPIMACSYFNGETALDASDQVIGMGVKS